MISFIYLFTYVIKNLSLENRNTLKSAILSLNDTKSIDRYVLY